MMSVGTMSLLSKRLRLAGFLGAIYFLPTTNGCGGETGPGVQPLPYTPRWSVPNSTKDDAENKAEDSSGASDPSSNTTGSETGKSTFDPATVYFSGSVSERGCYRAIAHWSDPETALTGFGCNDRVHASIIHPVSGKLIYSAGLGSAGQESTELRQFKCDSCPFRGEPSDYPEDTSSNDTVILETKSCVYYELRFDITPEGRVVHSCGQSREWADDSGVFYESEGVVLEWGADGQVLHRGSREPGTGYRYYLADSAVPQPPIEIDWDSRRQLITTRPLPDGGFWAVGRSRDSEIFERWRIGADGTVQMELAYALRPDDTTIEDSNTTIDWAVLDREGALYVLGSSGTEVVEDLDELEEVIILFPGDGSGTSVVYNEASEPFVKLYGSAFVTGP